MIESDEMCDLAIMMSALEDLLAERIDATLPASTISAYSAPWFRKQAADAARLRARELAGMAVDYCDLTGKSLQ